MLPLLIQYPTPKNECNTMQGKKIPILTWFQDSHLAVGHAVEIIGKVDQNLHIKVQAATDFGTEIGTY